MIIERAQSSITEADVIAAERELGFPLPPCIRDHYLRWNGGVPIPDYFGTPAYASVGDILPIKSFNDSESVLDVYLDLVEDRALVPPRWLPFANDWGGDYFFADCSTLEAKIFLYRHEHWDEPDRCVTPLNVTFPEFWRKLVDKSEYVE